jgi:hypothetical protein
MCSSTEIFFTKVILDILLQAKQQLAAFLLPVVCSSRACSRPPLYGASRGAAEHLPVLQHFHQPLRLKPSGIFFARCVAPITQFFFSAAGRFDSRLCDALAAP